VGVNDKQPLVVGFYFSHHSRVLLALSGA